VPEYAEVPLEIVDRLRSVCLALPDAYEEQAWVGVRWRVRQKTFAHVLTVVSGHPAAYAQAAGVSGPVTLMTFRAPDQELDALVASGHPFFRARWGRDVAGMVFGADVDWAEVGELLTESFCMMAPKKLTSLVNRPS
jgi:hypothetical protein